MSVELGALQVEDGASIESSPDTLKAKIELVAAMGVLAVGLDLSRLSEGELEKLRINDMLYLAFSENKRRLTVATEIIKTMRRKRDPLAHQIRGGSFGRAYNYLTSLDSDPHNQP